MGKLKTSESLGCREVYRCVKNAEILGLTFCEEEKASSPESAMKALSSQHTAYLASEVVFLLLELIVQSPFASPLPAYLKGLA